MAGFVGSVPIIGKAVNTLLGKLVPSPPQLSIPPGLLTPSPAPKMPVLPSASDLQIQQAELERQRLAAARVASGRAATILTQPSGDKLGA